MPPRTNREGQSDKSKGGTRFQKDMHLWLVTCLERHSLDNMFHIENAQKFCSGTVSIKPDHVIRRNDGLMVVCGGSKRSLRERWKVDDRDARIFKQWFPSCLWIEFTRQEKDDASAATINRFLALIHKQSAFDFFASPSVPDTMNVLANGLVKYLKGTARHMPYSLAAMQ